MIKATKALAKRRTLFAVVLAVTIFGAVYGFAATLTVGSNNLSAGNAIAASCDLTGNGKTTYATGYDTTLGGYKVSTVTVSGLDTTCNGKTISVTLTGSGANLPETLTSGTVTSGSFSGTPSSIVAAHDLTGVSVAING